MEMLLFHTYSSHFSLFTKDSRRLNCVLVSWLDYWWCAMGRKRSGSVLVEPLQLFEHVRVMLSSIYFIIKLFNLNCLQILNETRETPSNKETFIQPLTQRDTQALHHFYYLHNRWRWLVGTFIFLFWKRPLWWEKYNFNPFCGENAALFQSCELCII